MNTRQNLFYEFLCLWREDERVRIVVGMTLWSILMGYLGYLIGSYGA